MRTAYWLTIILTLLGPQKHTRQYERIDMAIISRWQASTGAWKLDGNWDSGSFPGTTVDGTDVAIFDGLSQVSPSADLDPSNRIQRILVEPTFTGDIGAPGNPLKADTGANALGRLVHRGPGRVYLESNTGGIAVIDSPNQTDACTLSGPMDDVFVKAGHCRVTSTAAIGGFAVVNGPGARLVIEAGATPPDWLVVINGVCENKRALTSGDTIVVMGGLLIQTGLVPTGVKVFVAPAGRMTYNPNVSIGANKPDLLNAGLVDAGGSAQDIAFDDFVLSVESSIVGSISQAAEPTSVSINVDLRLNQP